jgi:hypothetical protein
VNLIALLVAVLVVCLVLALINHFIPMPAVARVVLNAVVVLIICCWLLNLVGLGAFNGLLVTFVICCLLLYLINTLIPWTSYPAYQIWVNVAVALILCIVLLYMAGLLGGVSLNVPVGRPLVR